MTLLHDTELAYLERGSPRRVLATVILLGLFITCGVAAAVWTLASMFLDNGSSGVLTWGRAGVVLVGTALFLWAAYEAWQRR